MTRYKGNNFPTATPERIALVNRYHRARDKYRSYCKLTNIVFPSNHNDINIHYDEGHHDSFITLEGATAYYEALCKKYGLTK